MFTHISCFSLLNSELRSRSACRYPPPPWGINCYMFLKIENYIVYLFLRHNKVSFLLCKLCIFLFISLFQHSGVDTFWPHRTQKITLQQGKAWEKTERVIWTRGIKQETILHYYRILSMQVWKCGSAEYPAQVWKRSLQTNFRFLL